VLKFNVLSTEVDLYTIIIIMIMIMIMIIIIINTLFSEGNS